MFCLSGIIYVNYPLVFCWLFEFAPKVLILKKNVKIKLIHIIMSKTKDHLKYFNLGKVFSENVVKIRKCQR